MDELVDQSEMPIREDQETANKWVRSILLKLIANEFPLNPDLMRKQTADFIGDGMTEEECRRTISDALTGLEYEGLIRRESDGYYYPTAKDACFRICRGRQISFISTVELASVMRLVCSDMPGQPKSMFFDEVMSLYGFFNLNKSIERGLDKAFDLLESLQLVKTEKRHIYAEGEITDTPDKPFGEILRTLHHVRTVKPAHHTESNPSVKTRSVRTVDIPTNDKKKHDERKSILDEKETNKPTDVHAADSAKDVPFSTEHMKRQFTTYGEKYGLTYSEPVNADKIPNRKLYASNATWLRASVVYLVSREYPLVFGMLCKQMTQPMIQAGILEHQIRGSLRKAIHDAESFVTCKHDVLMPIDRNGLHFKIIRHREIDFISKAEIAAVMEQVVRNNPYCSKNALFDEIFLIYGFDNFTAKIRNAFVASLDILVKGGRVKLDGMFYRCS